MAKKMSVPLAILIPGLWVAHDRIYEPVKAKNWSGLKQMWTGLDDAGNFTYISLVKTYGPLLIGAIIHKTASRVKLNDKISRATMGLLSI